MLGGKKLKQYHEPQRMTTQAVANDAKGKYTILPWSQRF